MGYTEIPEQAQRGRNKAVLNLDKNELTQSINVLQSVLNHLSVYPNSLPKFPVQPSIPDFLTTRISTSSRQTSLPPVNVITPSVAALQQRLGLDLGSGLGLGPVGTFSTESSKFNDIGSLSSPFSSSPIPTIPPIGPPGGNSRPGPIGRPKSPATSLNPMQGPLPGLQSQFGQLGFRSVDHGEVEAAQRALDVGSLSMGHPGLPPVRVSTGQVSYVQPIGPGALNPASQVTKAMPGMAESGLGLDRAMDSGRIGAFQNQQGGVGVSGFGQGRPGTPGTPQGGRLTSQQMNSLVLQQVAKGTYSRPQSGGQSRPETPKAQGESKPGTSGILRVPEASSAWKGQWTTAVAEHNRDVVNGMLYASDLDGLVGGEAHTGWLISSSKKLLNLWECTAYSRASEPALQACPQTRPLKATEDEVAQLWYHGGYGASNVSLPNKGQVIPLLMHSQTTEFMMEAMDLDSNAKMLLSLCAHPRDPGFCIALHSLAGESFFNFKGMIRVPDTGISALRKQAPSGMGLLHLASLQPLGGPLKASVAVAVNGDVLVYDLAAATTAPTVPGTPKAFWKAHDTPVSSLHRSSFACALFTGGSDGSIRLWDLKTKPSAPVRQFTHPSLKAISGITMLDSNTVGSSGVDGTVNVWDIRNVGSPVFQIIPDMKPVIQVAASPRREALALTTRKGLYCLELSGPGGVNSVISPLTPLPPAGPCTDMKWNEKTKQIYCSGVDGAITVFGKS